MFLTACSVPYYDRPMVVSIDGEKVVYKVLMDSSSYSPGIIVENGKLIFPKCKLKKDCEVTYKAEAITINRYRVLIPKTDEVSWNELKKLIR